MGEQRKIIMVSADGILMDFLYASLRLFNRTDLYTNWPAGVWDIPKTLGIQKNDFWDRIANAAYKFWREVPMTFWNKEAFNCVLQGASETGSDVYIVVNPTMDTRSIQGKVDWLRGYFDKYFTDYIVVHDKTILARPGCTLVSVCEEIVNNFNASGGNGVLFPAVTNSFKCCPTKENLGSVLEGIRKVGVNGG